MRPRSVSLHGVGERGVSQAVALRAHSVDGGCLCGILSARKNLLSAQQCIGQWRAIGIRFRVRFDTSRLNVYGRCLFNFISNACPRGLSCPPPCSETPSGDTGKTRENTVFQKCTRCVIGPTNRFRRLGRRTVTRIVSMAVRRFRLVGFRISAEWRLKTRTCLS